MNRARLALAWPTYNRPEVLRQHLLAIRREAIELGVSIYISDDSDNLWTKEVAVAASDKELTVHYRHNRPALRHDRNLLFTANWPEADFVWLLGDKLRPAPGALAEVLSVLTDQDFVLVNWNSSDRRRLKELRDGDAREFLTTILWHQALTGATIYNRRVLNELGDIHVWPNFPQISLILERAGRSPFKIGWLGSSSLVAGTGLSASYWLQEPFGTFVRDWSNVVRAFPNVIPRNKLIKVLKEHSRQTGLFDADKMMMLRDAGRFGWKTIFMRDFFKVMHLRPWQIILLLILPPALVQRIRILFSPKTEKSTASRKHR